MFTLNAKGLATVMIATWLGCMLFVAILNEFVYGSEIVFEQKKNEH